jgi:hypothetical protein
VPRQDAQGRWISDDGLFYWDGATWRPTGSVPAGGGILPPPVHGKSAWPAILVGCGITLVVVLVLAIVGVFAVVSNPEIQRSFCNGYTSNDPNLTCPFSPSR